jgi:hypothetical protein
VRAFRTTQGPPSIDRLELRVFPTVRAAWAAMMRDEIDVLFEVGREAVEFVEAESAAGLFVHAALDFRVVVQHAKSGALARRCGGR